MFVLATFSLPTLVSSLLLFSVKNDEQSDAPAATISLEEALEMDQLPHSVVETAQRKAPSEFPLWLQRVATVSESMR